MKPGLKEIHAVVADEIDESIFAGDAPRPDIRSHLLEVFRLADAGERVSHYRFNQIEYS